MTTNITACPWQMKAIEMAACSVLMLLSLVGNSMLVAVFYRNKSLRTMVHCFIANTAVSDLIIPMFFLPAKISEIFHNGQWLVGGALGNIFCKIVWTAPNASVIISMLSMMAIAVDRFYAIVFPMKTALLARRRYLILLSWIFPIAVQSYWFFKIRIEENNNSFRCHKPERLLFYNLFLSLFILTAVTLTALYSVIITTLYFQHTRLHLANEATKLRAKENRRVTIMLIFLVVPFYLLWIPFYVFECNPTNDCLLSWITCILPLWYTIVNPVVLFIFSDTFRQGIKEIIVCCSRRKCKITCKITSVKLPVKG